MMHTAAGELLTHAGYATRDGTPVSIPPGWYAATWSGDTVTILAREGSPLLLPTALGVRGTVDVMIEVEFTIARVWERSTVYIPDVLPDWAGP